MQDEFFWYLSLAVRPDSNYMEKVGTFNRKAPYTTCEEGLGELNPSCWEPWAYIARGNF